MRASSRWMSVSLPAHVVARLAEHSIVDFVASDEPVAASLDIARQAANEAPVEVPESAFKGAGRDDRAWSTPAWPSIRTSRR